jgi:hypothetical protein
MKRFFYIFKQMLNLIRTHKIYFMAPILIMITLLAFVALVVGPSVITSFIYAGL